MNALKLYRGRSGRASLWLGGLGLAVIFASLYAALEATTGRGTTLIMYPPVFWTAFTLAARRLHDRGHSARWLLALAVPILGPLWLGIELGLIRGTRGANRWGPEPVRAAPGYLTVT